MKRKMKTDINYNFNTKIIKHNNDLPIYFYNNNTDINTDSWFDIKTNNTIIEKPNIKVNNKFKKEEIIECQKVKMLLNSEQKEIINKWFYSYTCMYNETLKYIKNNYKLTKNDITRSILVEELNKLKSENKESFDNFYYLRNQLKTIRDIIKNNTQISSINRDTKMQTHNLDYAIRQLCSNIKSAKSNLLKGNINRFRLKYWRHNRCSKTIEIEKCYILQNKICPKILGNIKYIYNGKDYTLNNINSNIKINYNSITDEYTLLIPIKSETIIIPNKKSNLISLDPGLRTFMTGISENKSVTIGSNVNYTIGNDIKRINKIKDNEKIPNKIKKKNEILINRKIRNKIDDLHWKSINYLVKNYNTILIGDMSAKRIVNKNKSYLSNIQKVACLRTKYYQFNQRLQNKCKKYNVNYKLVDESFTSKTCSCCAKYDDKLGSSKVYNCKFCLSSIDRDINGARNIYIKNLL